MHEATATDYEPTSWLVVFHVSTGKPWLDRLIPGRFKHVSAISWSEPAKAWLFYEPAYTRTQVYVVPGKQGDYRAAITMRGNTVLRVPVRKDGARALPRFGFFCVPAIAHLLGIRGGALPHMLHKACLAAGATSVPTGQPDESLSTADAAADSGGACSRRACEA